MINNWFKHDANARNDIKIIKLRRIAGMEGVGAFWCIVEMLRETDGWKIPLSSIDDIFYDLRCDISVFDKIVVSGLIEKDTQFFWSNSLMSRMGEYESVREQRRIAGSKGGKAKHVNSKTEAIAIDELSNCLASRIELSRIDNKVEETNIFPEKSGHKKSIEERKEDLRTKLVHLVEVLGKEETRKFFNYWTEHNENGKKMRFEMQKTFNLKMRLNTWKENNFGKPIQKPIGVISETEQQRRAGQFNGGKVSKLKIIDESHLFD